MALQRHFRKWRRNFSDRVVSEPLITLRGKGLVIMGIAWSIRLAPFFQTTLEDLLCLMSANYTRPYMKNISIFFFFYSFCFNNWLTFSKIIFSRSKYYENNIPMKMFLIVDILKKKTFKNRLIYWQNSIGLFIL